MISRSNLDRVGEVEESQEEDDDDDNTGRKNYEGKGGKFLEKKKSTMHDMVKDYTYS